MARTNSVVRRQPRGFTLVEVLVALSILALLSLLSWRTLDGMTRTEALTRETALAWLEWQTALAQWTTDLNAMHESPMLPGLAFDGLSLRWVRYHPDPPPGLASALMVVAWAQQSAPDAPTGSRWARWASPPIATRQGLDAAWTAAELWARSSVSGTQAHAPLLPALSGWQVFYHRGGVWSNPLSAAAASDSALPDGIRLVLTLPDEGHLTGQLTRDWIRPVLGGSRSL